MYGNKDIGMSGAAARTGIFIKKKAINKIKVKN